MREQMSAFHLPRYREIPDVGLYLDQTVKYINRSLEPLSCGELTASMIANYVKQGYVRNPVKKQYDAEQIARLTVIALVKNVLSMENIGKLFRYCQESTTLTESYDLFCAELEEQLRHLYDGTELPQRPQGDALDLLHSVVTACANVLYLNSSFDKLTFPPEEPKSK